MGAPPTRKKNSCHLSFTSNRRFGIELELNSFDSENRPQKGDRPLGIDVISSIVAEAAPESGCEIRQWEHTTNNRRWIAKPDSSCGLEVVSPPRKGWKGLKETLNVVDALSKDSRIKADHRCSVHVHTEIADLSEEQLAAVVSWWVKAEPVIIDAMPMGRKRNRYCQLIGMNNMFQHDGVYSNQDIIQRVGDVKYYSFNTNQYVRGGRKTIEFRTIEGGGCTDPYLVKQWIRFLIHFVETAAKLGRPKDYHEPKNDDERHNLTPWTGLVWLDPQDVLTMLGFNNIEAAIPGHRKATHFTLSKGMQQTRNWFLARLAKYMSRHKPGGMRYYALQQLNEVLKREKEILGKDFDPQEYLSPSELQHDVIFGEDYIY